MDWVPISELYSGDCVWMTWDTVIPGEKTLDPSMRSFPQLERLGDTSFDKHPWMSPGSAPVYSPCGVYYGNPYGCSKAPLGEASLEVIKSGNIEEECQNTHGVWA